MGTRESLATATLDTLPLTVAVLDEDGTILLTNRSWREFGSGRPDADDVGVDYVAVAAEADDEHAQRAVDGLESVLSGERESFSMEYPCHSPERKRWFLMRANRFDVGGEGRVSVVHLDITERKLAEIDAAEAAEDLREERRTLEHVLDRIDGLLRDVTDAAVGARTRTEVERRTCERLVETDPYVYAWIGRVDVTSRRLVPHERAARDDLPLADGERASAGGDGDEAARPDEDELGLAEDELRLDGDEHHPAVRALEAGEPVVLDDLASVAADERWWPAAAGDRFRSVAAFPLSYGEVTYGALVVYADAADAFAAREREVLDSLAGTIATALNGVETRRTLTTTSVVELRIAVEDPSLPPTALAEALEASIGYRGATYDEDGTPLLFFHVDRSGGVVEAARSIESVRRVDPIAVHDDGTVLELAVDDELFSLVTEHGGVIRRFDGDGPVADLTLSLPSSDRARSVYDALSDRYDAVELLSYRERERPERSPRDVANRVESTLTDRQLLALRKAYYAGYYDWPREVSGEELAASMDISRSTFHQHLRTAERKLLDELFDGYPD